MNSTDSRARLVVACDAARTGGRLALAMFAEREKLEVDMKGRQDRATEADRRVEQAIRETIGSHYPDAPILGEEFGLETGTAGSDDLWVVDPIDGTDCFIFGLPMWSISIAWLRDGSIRAGAVYDPVHDEMFAASLGHGAQLNGKGIAASEASRSGSRTGRNWPFDADSASGDPSRDKPSSETRRPVPPMRLGSAFPCLGRCGAPHCI